MEDVNFKVCVRCTTYNHSLYIEDAMNGFVSQQTDFPFVCVIIDDASTDNEQDVIKSYLSGFEDISKEENDDYVMQFARHKLNRNCYFVVYYLKYNHRQIKKSKSDYFMRWTKGTEYTALCEGDDYWIDDKKLQKQSDFLNHHTDYSLCVSRENRRIGADTIEFKRGEAKNRTIGIKELILTQYIATASIFYRSRFLPLPSVITSQHVGDYPLRIYLGYKGKVFFMEDIMCVYRENSIGSWSCKIKALDWDGVKKLCANEAKMFTELDMFTGNRFHKTFVKKKHRALFWKMTNAGYYNIHVLLHLVAGFSIIFELGVYKGYIKGLFLNHIMR